MGKPGKFGGELLLARMEMKGPRRHGAGLGAFIVIILIHQSPSATSSAVMSSATG